MRWMSELIGFKFALGNHLVHGKWSSWRLNSPSRSDFLGEQPFHYGSWKGREMVTPATSPSNWKVHSLRVDVQSSKFPPHWRGRCYFRAQIQLVKFWTGLINEAISVSYRIVVASVVIYGGRLTEKKIETKDCDEESFSAFGSLKRLCFWSTATAWRGDNLNVASESVHSSSLLLRSTWTTWR